MKLYAVRMSVIYKCSVMRVLTFKVAAYVLLYDLLWLGHVLGTWCDRSEVRVGRGVWLVGFSGESQRFCWGIMCQFSVYHCVLCSLFWVGSCVGFMV